MDPAPILNQTTTGWVAALALGAAVFERVRNIRLNKEATNNEAKVSLAKDELVRVITADRDTWKTRFDGVNAEFIAYREAAHKKDEIVQAKMLALNEEVGQLRAKTDMTPVMQTLREQAESAASSRKEQSDINRAVLEGLVSLTNAVNELSERRMHEAHHHAPHGQQQQQPQYERHED